MTISNRNVSITGVFAEDANTTIPDVPVVGTSYRDTSMTETDVNNGWSYKTIVDSAQFNEALYEYSKISKLLETYGFLPWSNLTNYETGSLCLGSNGVIYQAKQNTGPSSTAKDPTTDSNNTYWKDFVGDTYVTKATAQTISGNKTFSGSNTFSGSVSLGALATATTPAYSDNDTSVATTAMVHNLNDTQRTNCITEIPQDIKLELSSGTLTLKSGSKVYIPNGTGVFNTFTLQSDIIASSWGSGSDDIMLFINQSGSASFTGIPESRCYSGTAQPTVTGGTDAFWYDTTNNTIKQTTDSGSTWTAVNISLPICTFTRSSGTITGIKQVFNGFGYIGSTVFALPGVKGLIPNGRNSDGTLKSTAFTISSVLTTTDVSGATGVLEYWLSGSSINRVNFSTYSYDSEKNIVVNSSGVKQNIILLDSNAYRTSGRVTSFNPKPAFHAVDYYDLAQANSNISTLDAQNVKLTGNQTIAGTKTFSSKITGSISGSCDGNAGTVTNGVYTTGNQTIAGNKTFSDFAKITKGGASLVIQRGIEAYTEVQTQKSDGTRTGGIRNITDNGNTTLMYVADAAGTTIKGSVNVIWDGTNAYATAPTPPSAIDNSGKIATTSWVRNHRCTTAATTTSTASVDAPAYVVENYKSGESWYRVWSDGWIEQGGQRQAMEADSEATITLIKAFTTTNYFLCDTSYLGGAITNKTISSCCIKNRNTTNFILIQDTYSDAGGTWFACGY